MFRIGLRSDFEIRLNSNECFDCSKQSKQSKQSQATPSKQSKASKSNVKWKDKMPKQKRVVASETSKSSVK